MNWLKRLLATGQASPALVIGIIIMLATVAFGGLIFGEIQDAAEEQSDDDCAGENTIAENIVRDVGELGVDVFPLILLVVLLAVFGAILAVLKMWG